MLLYCCESIKLPTMYSIVYETHFKCIYTILLKLQSLTHAPSVSLFQGYIWAGKVLYHLQDIFKGGSWYPTRLRHFQQVVF